MTRLNQHIARLKARGYDWPICWDAVDLLARSEDCRTAAYRCSAGVWTIGWGETDGIRPGMVWTLDQCDARLHQQVRSYAARVEALLTQPADEFELGAMVSLAYNIGLAAFAKSSVLRMHNAGDSEAAARAFGLWDKVRLGGKLVKSAGLAARRLREAAMYLRPVADTPAEPMPQAVEAERPMAQSKIAGGGAATAGIGVITAAASAIGDQVQQAAGVMGTIKAAAGQVADFIGVPPGLLVGAVLVLIGWQIVRWRHQQRAEGLA